MKVIVSQSEPLAAGAGLAVVGLYEDGSPPESVAGLAGAGDARGSFKKKLLLHSGEARVLVIGLGKREEADAERLRVAAALAAKEAGRLEASSVAWVLPETGDDTAAAEALVTGTILGSYRFDRFKGKGTSKDDAPAPGIETLTLLGPESVATAAETARIYAEAQNRARDLQSTPANFATPSYLASRAEEIAAGHDAVSVDVLGPEQIAAKGMGGLVAVSRGGGEPARLIVLRYSGGGCRPDPGPGRQGRHLRHRRDLAQARSRDARDEVRHVRGGRGAGVGRGDRRARTRARCRRRRALDREHALRHGDQARRRDHPVQRRHRRGQQHRRRGPTDPRRRARLRGRARGRADRRSRHPDRRRRDRPRLYLRGGDRQRRRARGGGRGGPARRAAS